ncbi:MAG: hypothetical protein KAW83_03020 [Dehalococcoidia bacterium]|nr:hypothetical protein [Dehalococcoidia bacterium]
MKEGAVFCPFCGTKLAESGARPITEVKRHLSITICAILLFICALIHIINMGDFMAYGDFAGSIGQLFFVLFALIAGLFLWKSKEIGGIIGLAYGIISTIATLALLAYFSEWVTVYGLIIDFSLNTAIIILIIVGWKHLKHS